MVRTALERTLLVALAAVSSDDTGSMTPDLEVSTSDFTIWIVEDSPLLRESYADVINGTAGFCCPVAVESCEQALDALKRFDAPEVLLMDIGLPGMTGIEGIERVHELSPSTRIVMLTMHEDQDRVFRALCAGAAGYILKPSSAEEIVSAIDEVREGGVPMSAQIAHRVLNIFQSLGAPTAEYGLTEREREILDLLVDGLTQKVVARQLELSRHTVNTHIRNIYAKLNVRTRGGAVAKALKERLI